MKKIPTTPITDPEQFKEIILWAREHGIALTELAVGNVRALLIDTVRMPAPKPEADDARRMWNLYAQYGGEVLASAAIETEKDEEEDDED
ncbi:MAG: hypothetical protein ACREJC_09740 [Tepidisphaeraceae bacterium]